MISTWMVTKPVISPGDLFAMVTDTLVALVGPSLAVALTVDAANVDRAEER